MCKFIFDDHTMHDTFYFEIQLFVETSVAFGVLAVLVETYLGQGQNLCAGTGLCGLPWFPGWLPWPPVDDGTDNIYIYIYIEIQSFKYDIRTKNSV